MTDEEFKPFTDDDKREIVVTFRALKAAIEQGDPSMQAKYSAFRTAYRGNSHGYLEHFHRATDKPHWAGQLEIYLQGEIESSFWLAQD